MRSRHRPRLSWVRVLAAAWGLLQIGCTTYPTPPAQPAFDTDVLPIFEAHCTRCHGNGPDGGSLNTAYIPGTGLGTGVLTAQAPCLTQFGNNPDTYASCAAGAASFVSLIKTYIQPGYQLRMPPPPAAELNSFEMDVVNTWTSESTPICSRSSNPDPALFCNSM